MAYTTYPYGIGSEENPCLAASNDLIHWEKPEGLINPIACCEEVECDELKDTHLLYVSFTRRMMLKKSINQIKALIVPRILVQIPLLFVLQCLSKSVWVVWGISMILSVAAHYFLFYRGKCLTGGIVMGTLCAASTTFVYQVMSEAIAWIKWLA